MTVKAKGSQVPLGTHFGGGAAAVPPAPVAPRSDVATEAYLALLVCSLAALGGGIVWVARTRERGGSRREGHHAA